MNADDFSDQVKTFRARGGATAKRSRKRGPAGSNRSDEKLQSAFEELQVAEDELRQQNEELISTRLSVETERQRYRDLFNSAPDGYIVTDQYGTIQEANRAAASLLHFSQSYLVNKPLPSYVAAKDRSEFRQRLAQLDEGIEAVSWETCLQARNGAEIDVLLRVGAVRDISGGVHALRWLLHDITERKEAEARIRRRNQELEALNAIISPISRTLDLATILATLKSVLLERLAIPGGAIFVPEENKDRLRLEAHWGLSRRALADLVEATCGTINDGQFDRDSLSELAPAHRQAIQRVMADGKKRTWANWKCHECVLLETEERAQGFIDLFHQEPEAFSGEQSIFFNILGQQVSVAIQNARLYEKVRTGREQLQMLSRRLVEVQEQERRFIARELHDEIGQALTGLKICLEAGHYLPPDVAKRRLDEAWNIANQLIGQVRDLSLELRPAMLDDLGLFAALRWHFRRYTTQTGVKVTFHEEALDRRFSGEVETAAYRILQEALTNVARYAKVDEVSVKLWTDPATLYLEVSDSGVGFDPSALKKGGSNGLTGMQERAALLGGRLKIKSARGKGTVLVVELPLEADDKPHKSRS
jgi:PAS domain S-box-containing protein